MNKQRKLYQANHTKKFLALGCSAALVMSSLSGCGSQGMEIVHAQEEISFLEDAVESLSDSGIIKHSDTAGKEETVYVMMDADGKVSSTIVSEWLKNPTGAEQVTDTSTLTDIRTVKGTASYTQNGNRLNWVTDGSDIYYQGQTKAKLPIDIHITYELNGKKVTAKELDGASGHLKITFDYKNNTATERVIHGEKRTIYQPFMVISGLMFDNEKVANVEISNGKSVNSGDKTMVFGVAMPGLADSLGLDELEDSDGKPIETDIPEQVVIDADVTDFSLLMTLSIATNNALNELGLDDFDSLDDLKDKMSELTDGMDDIIDGATQLDDGVAELSDGTGELSEGTGDLSNGAYDLADGAQKLLHGSGQLNNGAYKLKNGTKKVNTGAQQVNDGAAALKAGIDELKKKAPELTQGVTALTEGAGALSEGMDTITANNEALNSGATAVADGLNTLNTALSDENAQTQLNALVNGSAEVKTGLETTAGGLDAIVAGYDPEGEDLSVLIATLSAYATNLESTGDAQNIAIAGAIHTMVDTYQGMYTNVETVSTGVNALNSNYPAIDAGIGSVAGNLQTVTASVNQLSTGASSLRTGVSNYTAGVSNVVGGVNTLKGGLDTLNSQLPALVSGIDQLSAGADTLATGTSELAKGTGDLEKGAKDLEKGTDDLAEGARDLAEGAGKLSDGTEDLKDGVKKLTDGVAELLDGTGELKDGVIKFNEEGISKLSELVNDDLDKFYDRLCAVRDYAEEYDSFAGANEGMKCSVKFIYKTEEIGKK